MGKKGSIINIPLQAELCLNKAKVDITEFNGWQKNNAPVYGNCLSPLYKKDSEHHDFFLGENEDYYDIVNGNLLKNGETVLEGSGSKMLKKQKLSVNYDSLVITENDNKTYFRQTSATRGKYSLNGSTEAEFGTGPTATKIICAKAFGDSDYGVYGVAVWYLVSTGVYYLRVRFNINGTDYVKDFNGFAIDVTAPFMQVGIFNAEQFMISIYGSKGNEKENIPVKNVMCSKVNGNYTLSEITSFVASGFTMETYPVSIKDVKWTAKITTYNRDSYGYYRNYGAAVASIKQSLFLAFSEAIWQPTDGGWKAKVYLAPTSCIGSNIDKNYWVQVGTIDSGTVSKEIELGKYIWSQSATGGSSANTPVVETSGNLFTVWDNATPNKWCVAIEYKSDEQPNDKYVAGNLTSHYTYSLMGNDDTPSLSVENYYSSEISSVSAGIPNEPSYWYKAYRPTDMSVFYGTGPNRKTATNIYTSYQMKFDKNDYSHMQVTNASKTLISIYTKPSEETVSPLKEVDCVMDDGRLYTIGQLYTRGHEMPVSKTIILAGMFSSYADGVLTYTANSVLNIAYDVKNNIFPRYYYGTVICLDNNYLRVIHNFKAKESDSDYIPVLVDSATLNDNTQKKAVMCPGIIKGGEVNKQGTCYNTKTSGVGWRFLFNNNLMYGISVYENPKYIGTLVTDWISIDTDWSPAWNSHTLVYKDNSGTLWKIDLIDDSADWLYQIVENRYIVINTVNYFNCYDTKTGLKRHWASDYNNRCYYGLGFDYYSNNSEFAAFLNKTSRTLLLATGQNANYEMTKDSITSIEFGAMIYSGVKLGYLTFVDTDVPYGAVEGIDYYDSEYEDSSSTSAQYQKSFINGYSYINTDLTDPAAIYPISSSGDIRYSPSIFSKFITSYNNKDMVISDGIAYPLEYYNNTIPIISFFMLKGMEGLENAFVLQTSFYGVSKDRLYQLNYNNGVSAEAVCDITNMEFLGALPTKALFWSAQNRAIYMFGGSCIMQLSQYANDLEYINGKWYNTATQELFLDTNIGLLVFSDLGTYCLEDCKNVKDIFFYKDHFIVNKEGEEEAETIYYSYNALEQYTSNKIKFLTKYYGNNNTPITVNNIYIHIYSLDETDELEPTGDNPLRDGKVTFKGYTITDVGFETDVKEVAIGSHIEQNEEGEDEVVLDEQWDEQTKTILLKYTPQYNRGLGVALEVESDFPIVDIKYDVVDSAPSESQLSHINL